MKLPTIRTNDYIWVADGLPHQKPEIKKVKKIDFATKHRFLWSELYTFTDEVSKEEQEAFYAELDSFLQATYDRSLAEIEDSLMLCPMGDSYGVFTRKPITNGIIAIHTGQYVMNNRSCVSLADSKMEFNLGTTVPNISIFSLDVRNISSYFKHLFSSECPDVMFNVEPGENNFAVANLRMTQVTIRNWPVIIIGSTLPMIPKHSLVGYDFSLEHFRSKNMRPPCYMTNGELYKDQTPYEICSDNLQALRAIGLNLYNHIEALQKSAPTTSGFTVNNLDQFIHCLSELDFAILRSTAMGVVDLSEEVKRPDFPQLWRDLRLFVKLILPKIEDRNQFITQVKIFTLYYEMCELLSTCDPKILDQLNNRFPKKFNYLDLFHQGLSNVQIILQSIILKNTGDRRIAKPTFQAFFDDKKAFWFHVKNKAPALCNALLSEYPKYKLPESIASNRSRAPFLNNQPASENDYIKMCEHLKNVCGGDWKYHYANKSIWVTGEKVTVKEIKDYLKEHGIKTTGIGVIPNQENVYYFKIKNSNPEQINSIPKMPTIAHN